MFGSNRFLLTLGILLGGVSLPLASNVFGDEATYRVSKSGCRFFELVNGSWRGVDPVIHPPVGAEVRASVHPLSAKYLVIRNTGRIFIMEQNCLATSVLGPTYREEVAPPPLSPPVALEPVPTREPVPTKAAPKPVLSQKDLDQLKTFSVLFGYWLWQDSHSLLDASEFATPIRSNMTAWGVGLSKAFRSKSDFSVWTEGYLLIGTAQSATVNSALFSAEDVSLVALILDPSFRYAPPDTKYSVGFGVPIVYRQAYFPELTNYIISDSLLRLGLLVEGAWTSESGFQVGIKTGLLRTPAYSMFNLSLGWSW